MILTGIILSTSCGSPSNPSSPAISTEKNHQADSGDRLLWGLWHITIDGSTMAAEVAPLRSSQLTCNVTRFMQPPVSPTQMIQIYVDPSSTPVTGYFAVEVSLKHPFPGLNMYRGFDVRGVLIADGSIYGTHDPDICRAGVGDTQLLNPDGYTRWWNYQEFTSYNSLFGFTHGKLAPPNHPNCTVNPYKLFSDELEASDPLSVLDPDSRVTFSTLPGINKRRYDIQFKMDGPKVVFDFDYAVDASWSEPDSSFNPEYPEEAFDLSANCNEAYEISVADAGSTAYYVSGSNKGGEIKLDIEVFDHQAVASPNGMADEIEAIWVEGDVLTTPVDILPTATILPGSGGQSSVYEASLGNLDLTASGDTELFITVESKNVTTYEPQIAGGSIFHFPDAPLAAYLSYTTVISDHSIAPPPEVTSVIPNSGNAGTTIDDVEVHGLYFVSGAVVELKHSTSGFTIGPISTIFGGSDLLTLDLNLAGAQTGFYDVTVTNPDTQYGTLEDGFEVTGTIWWQSHMYNVTNLGWNPTANLPDPSSLQQQWMTPVNGFKFTTPVVADDKIFFTMNSTYWERADMAIYCYDLNSGSQLWTKPINPTSASTGWRAFSCPVWWSGSDGINRIAVGGDQVYCFNADTGAQLWTYDTTEGGTDIGWWSNQMKEYNGLVIAHSRFSYVYILDFMTGSLVTKITTTSASEGGCAIADDKVYINSAYYIDCADLNSGAILWTTPVPGGYGDMDHWINPTVIDNRVYVTTYYAYVLCLATTNDGGYTPGQIIWDWHDSSKPLSSFGMIAGLGARKVGSTTRLTISSSS
ncbi:MAG: PQQ-binding-like beta-propeller repeat protein, partial [bacterium]